MYRLIARIEHKESGNVIFTFNGKDEFEQFNTLKSKCEHCNTIRYRNVSFILEDENGTRIQVGSSCVKHYKTEEEMDLKERAVMYSTLELRDEMFSFKGKTMYSVDSIILAYIHTKNQPKSNFDATDWFNKNSKELTEEDYDTLALVKEHILTAKPRNAFLHNIAVYIEEEYIDYKGVNFVKWAYKVYKDAVNYALANNSSGLTNNNFVITKIWLEREYCDRTYSYYGTDKKVYRMYDENNNLIEYETSSDKDFASYINQKVSCKIKTQYNSKKGKVTKITNLKIA